MRLSPSTRQRLLQLTAQHGNFVNFERERGAPDRLALEHFGARLIRVIPRFSELLVARPLAIDGFPGLRLQSGPRR